MDNNVHLYFTIHLTVKYLCILLHQSKYQNYIATKDTSTEAGIICKRSWTQLLMADFMDHK